MSSTASLRPRKPNCWRPYGRALRRTPCLPPTRNALSSITAATAISKILPTSSPGIKSKRACSRNRHNFGIRLLPRRGRPKPRHVLLSPRHAQTSLGCRRNLLGATRYGCDRIALRYSLCRLLGPPRIHPFPPLRSTCRNSRRPPHVSQGVTASEPSLDLDLPLSGHRQPRPSRRHDRRRSRRRLLLSIQQPPLLSSLAAHPRLTHRHRPILLRARLGRPQERTLVDLAPRRGVCGSSLVLAPAQPQHTLARPPLARQLT